MNRSRLSKRMEEKTKKNLFLSILGIILILFLAFKFGVPLLVNLSSFLSGSQNQEQEINKNNSFIAPPILDSLPQATSSANIIISGISSKDHTINLYINDELIDKTDTDNEGKFSFKETITPGEKSIKVKAVIGKNESEFSEPMTIAFKSSLPSLNIISPASGQSFSKDQKTVDIQGTTDSDTRITVNDFWAITDDQGNFSYRFPLKDGENKIKIVALDIAGNKTEKEITVTYSP